MDKFGIFKILNSFFNFYEQNKNASQENQPNMFNSLLSSLTNPKDQNTQPQVQKKQENSPSPAHPLQSSMLSVMNSHDQFVKRVKEKNKT